MMKEEFQIVKLHKDVAVSEYLKECVHVEQFLPFCKECMNYGKTWSCPPFDFDPLNLWNQYNTFSLHAYKMIVPAKMREKKYEKEEKYTILESIMMETKKEFDQDMLSLEREVEQSGFSLSGGTCMHCAPGTCTRLSGEPCRHPEKMRYSIESLGGNVSKTVEKYFGEKMLWMEDGILPEYFILVGGILR